MTLLEYLETSGIVIDRENYKVHLAVQAQNSSPLQAFYDGEFNAWQCEQNARNFQCEHVLSLIHLGGSRWLFAGAYVVIGMTEDDGLFWYEMNLLPNQDNIIGRLIIQHERGGRASYRIGPTIMDDCVVNELLAQRLSVAEYPGHNNVRINYDTLRTIINNNEPTWFGALANIKGIYLITDTLNGKLYVGKADGLDGIWQRWSQYANNGHGDNVELRALIETEGQTYKSNFQYSLLEIADFRTGDDQINERESHWKNVLYSKEFGYNRN